MGLQTLLELRDRTLWADGDSSMSSDRMADRLLSGKSIEHIFPTEVDKSVKKFNLYADKQLGLKTEFRPFDFSFDIPEQYLNLNLRKYIFSKLKDAIINDNIDNDIDIEERITRVTTELELFNTYGIVDLIKTAIYIVDTFENNNIVWGTGRGSSCACYCLYLIGLHEVDSVSYKLELNEFFR